MTKFDPDKNHFVLTPYEASIVGLGHAELEVPQHSADVLLEIVTDATNRYRQIPDRTGSRIAPSRTMSYESLASLRTIWMGSVILDNAPSPADGAEQWLEIEDIFRQE
jgi:hypothetical protein